MSIRVKQIFIISLLFLSFGLLFFYSWKGKEFNKKIIQETQLNEQLYIELLQLRRAEKDFFSRYKRDIITAEKYLDKHNTLSVKYREKLQKIPTDRKEICEALFTKYQSRFKKLAELTLIVGSETEGLHATLNEMLTKIKWSSNESEKMVQSIKLLESNYLLSNKDNYKKKFKKRCMNC